MCHSKIPGIWSRHTQFSQEAKGKRLHNKKLPRLENGGQWAAIPNAIDV